MKNRKLVSRLSSLVSLAILALLPAGCLGPHRSPDVHLHALASTAIWDTFAARDLPADAPRIEIAPVILSRHLDRPQIVTLADASPDAELVPLDYHRWAMPLDASIREYVASRLLEKLPSATIDLYPAAPPTTPPAATVTLQILRMEGPLAGPVTLIASWQIPPSAPRVARYSATPADSTIPSYIHALREALTLLSDDLSAHLSSVLPSESGSGPLRQADSSDTPSKSTRKTSRKQKD